MNKEKLEKATLEALLERKLQKERDSYGIKEIDVPAIGMSITAVKQPISKVSDILDELEKDDISFSKTLDIYKQLIYLCVPLFHDKKLQEAYQCSEPYDVVVAVLDDNIGGIVKLAETILAMYGFTEIMNDVKNSSAQTES